MIVMTKSFAGKTALITGAGRGIGRAIAARLLAEGPKRIAQKVGEEGVETALAGVAGTDEDLASEAADLLYHLLVLLHARGMSLAAVLDILERRSKKGA